MTKVLFLLCIGAAGFYALQSFNPATGGFDRAMAEEDRKIDQMDTSHLTEKQKYITIHDGTEKPFENEYWDNHDPGIYVDVVTGEPLFSSTDKFDSGTGWPSFTKPIKDNFVTKKDDHKFGMTRTEVRSSHSDAHLGHVFPDGPKESGGYRYCINSGSMRFVPVDKLAAEGYGEYLTLFVGK